MRRNRLLLLYLVFTVILGVGGTMLILVIYAPLSENPTTNTTHENNISTTTPFDENTQLTTNIRYGLPPRNVFDLYKPNIAEPTPLMIFIHGGGFVSGDKSDINRVDHAVIRDDLLRAGISVASINYQFLESDRIDSILNNTSHIVWYLRDNAGALGIDPDRMGIYGSSAGGGIAMYVGLHPDTSQHIRVIGHIRSQSTYDVLQWPRILNIDVNPESWIRNVSSSSAVSNMYHMDEGNTITDPEITLLREAVDLPRFMDVDDPPILLQNYDRPQNAGSSFFNANPGVSQLVHSPLHAIYLNEQCVIHGITCHLNTVDTPADSRYDAAEFFIGYLTG